MSLAPAATLQPPTPYMLVGTAISSSTSNVFTHPVPGNIHHTLFTLSLWFLTLPTLPILSIAIPAKSLELASPIHVQIVILISMSNVLIPYLVLQIFINHIR